MYDIIAEYNMGIPHSTCACTHNVQCMHNTLDKIGWHTEELLAYSTKEDKRAAGGCMELVKITHDLVDDCTVNNTECIYMHCSIFGNPLQRFSC